MNISATARRGVLASASNTFRGARARSASSAASAAGAGIPAPGLDRAGYIAAGPIRPATRRRSATTEHYRRPRRRSQLYHRSESDSPGHARITAWNPLTRIGIYGSTPEAAYVSAIPARQTVWKTSMATRHPTSFPTSNQPQRRHRPQLLAAPRGPISERDEPAGHP